MSDRYAGRIHVGGTLPARKLADLARVIVDTDPGIEMNWSLMGEDRYVTAKHLRSWLVERDAPRPLFLHAGELVDGCFYGLEQWLDANEMSYLRHSDSYCDVEAEIVGRIDGTSVRSDANNAGDAMVRACDVWRAKEMLSQGKVLDAMALLNRLLPNVYDVPPFMVEYARGRLR
jgi:hypothetical protein